MNTLWPQEALSALRTERKLLWPEWKGQGAERSSRQLEWAGPDHSGSVSHGKRPGGSDGKASVYNAGDLGLIPGLGRFPGEGNGNPLQYSCLENPMDGGAWCRLLSMGSQRLEHN